MKNKIIITANPSFAVGIENDFWLQFGALCDHCGWKLFKHSMRKIPSDEQTMILPARLHDVAGYISCFPQGVTEWDLPEWMDMAKFEMIVDWEVLRWGLQERTSRIELGLRKLAWHVDYLFRYLNPAGVIVSNKIDHGTALFYWAADHYGATRVFFERSPLMSFIAEPAGMFAESEIWERYLAESHLKAGLFQKIGAKLAEELAANPEGFRKQTFEETGDVLGQIKAWSGRRIFLPMDNILWTGWAQENHWQGTVDYYPGTPEPSGAINLLARIAAMHGACLVVKMHPSDIQSYTCSEENVIFADAPINDIISACDVTVCFLTKLAFVSAAMGKPTVTLAPNTAAASNATFHADNVQDWAATISAALQATETDLSARKFRLHQLLGWLDQRFYLDASQPSNHAKPSTLSLFTHIAGSRAGITAHGSPSYMLQLISRMSCQFSDRRSWPSASIPGTNRFSLIFDVSRLANTRLHHSGISRFCMKLIEILSTDESVELVPTLMRPEILERGKFSENLGGFSEFLGLPVFLVSQLPEYLNGKNAAYFSPYDPLVDIPGWAGPRIATVHDVLHVTRSDLYLHARTRTHIEAVLSSIDVADTVVTVSEFTRAQLMRVKNLPPENVTTVHLGADDAFKPAPAELVREFREKHGLGELPYFVLFAQFEVRKNVPTVLSAIRYVLDHEDSDAQFVVIGASLGSGALGQALVNAGLDREEIILVEAPDDEEMATIYTGSCGMIYATLAEGFGLPVIEAMRCGCPVITSSLTSIPEVSADSVLYVDPYDVKQISDAILTLERSPTLREQLRKSTMERSLSFNWNKTAKGVLNVTRQAIASWRPSTNSEAANLKSAEWNIEIVESLAESSSARDMERILIMLCSRLILNRDQILPRLDDGGDLARVAARAIEALPEESPVRLQFHRVLRNARISYAGQLE
jgi:glycosyltransferase involved in cell wall biosynthesis